MKQRKMRSKNELFGILRGPECYFGFSWNKYIERVDLRDRKQRIEHAFRIMFGHATESSKESNERTIHSKIKTQFWVPYQVHTHTLTSSNNKKKKLKEDDLFLPNSRRKSVELIAKIFNSIHQFYK